MHKTKNIQAYTFFELSMYYVPKLLDIREYRLIIYQGLQIVVFGSSAESVTSYKVTIDRDINESRAKMKTSLL